jgi:hypothetical protein
MRTESPTGYVIPMSRSDSSHSRQAPDELEAQTTQRTSTIPPNGRRRSTTAASHGIGGSLANSSVENEDSLKRW